MQNDWLMTDWLKMTTKWRISYIGGNICKDSIFDELIDFRGADLQSIVRFAFVSF